MSDGHSTGNSVWINYDIRNYTIAGERHIFLSIQYSTGSLLSVATSELIADLWHSNAPNLDLRRQHTIIVERKDHLVNDSTLCGSHEGTRVLLLTLFPLIISHTHCFLNIFIKSNCFSNYCIIPTHSDARTNQPVNI
ncbi:hypothetical protein RF11_11794 [Thelohanellus kitauei]|uniref:Uncharacterized protein n=1 Tax=Thelohanellus kitauei TaxID=669202 RepID=A0A0C2MYX0_THEKT|nr:hypothetical protein RF11_11794 [Thelohanellus kitauei]